MAKRTKSKKKHEDDSSETSSSTPESSPSPSSSNSGEISRRRRRRHSRSRRDDESRSSRREKEYRKRERERSRSRKRKDRERTRGSRKGSKRRVFESEDESGSDYSESERSIEGAEVVVRDILKEFPGVDGDLKQLLLMIDNGQAVDIKGISEKSLMKHLKKLFVSLNLKENGDRVFLLRSNAHPTLETVGPIIASHAEAATKKADEPHSEQPGTDAIKSNGEDHVMRPNSDTDTPGPKRRVIGPEMPSAELLAAAAKLTEAEAEMREAELEHDNELFIGPPPPALVTEAESANEAERFEEVTRIMGVEAENPYDILGVNHKMPIENIKKRYWKLSLMVHPDKCPHPQAHQAFIKLNKGFKDLQDPDKRKAMDDKIKKREEEEEMKAELKSMREAALWRRSQGLSMEGDEVLLADLEEKGPPKRDEWMTSLPPERKPGGMSMHSTFFSRTGKEGRGDTSVWTDTPSDKAQKAKMNYLEAYNEATALASNEEKKQQESTDAALVDQYNKAKRSKSLVQKHQEETEKNRSKKKPKQQKQQQQQQQQQREDEDWVGKHPWKPWDREKDLTAGRQNVKLDSDNLAQGLSSRFSSSSFQRSFL